MLYEEFYGIKKGKAHEYDRLYNTYLKRAWFICYHITLDVCTATPLLLVSWRQTIENLIQLKEPPREDFLKLFSEELLKQTANELEHDASYGDIANPVIDSKFQLFVKNIDKLSELERKVYLIHVFGNLDRGKITDILREELAVIKKISNDAAAKVTRSPSKNSHADSANMITLYTQFKCPDGSAFKKIKIPSIILASVDHIAQTIGSGKGSNHFINRKESITMGTNNQAQKKNSKKTKKGLIIAGSIVAVVVIAAVVFLQSMGNAMALTTITTYNVEEITYGDVSTTISGSGTLTPVSSKALTPTDYEVETSSAMGTTTTMTYSGEVTTIDVAVGDEVKKDDVLLTITDENDDVEKIKAPYDGTILDIPVAVGDELGKDSELITVMGKDGFTIDIAVDELDIASVSIGQEVSFSIDAIEDGEYTGSVTNISYKGSTSGSVTSYKIVATVEHIDGVYPGMSASAEIIIESSGDGLLVPVDAVKTSGDDSYIYLAPSDATSGKVYEEKEIDTSKLTKVVVETGMSDGSYIMIKSDQLAEGNLIIVVKLTSTMTGSNNSGNGGMGGFGGMGGNMGDFDFGNFDPNNMPDGFPGFGN